METLIIAKRYLGHNVSKTGWLYHWVGKQNWQSQDRVLGSHCTFADFPTDYQGAGAAPHNASLPPENSEKVFLGLSSEDEKCNCRHGSDL